MARNRRKVRFGGEPPAVDHSQWQCLPDDSQAGPRSSDRVVTPVLVYEEAPDRLFRLRSAAGDCFEVHASVLWSSSSVIRGALEEDETEEEIPLPNVSTRALRVAELETISEVLWLAKLLEIESALCEPLAMLLQDLSPGSQDLCSIRPERLLFLMQHGSKDMSPDLLCLLMKTTAHTSGSDLVRLLATTLVPFLGHGSEKVRDVTLATLQQIPALEAQVALLTHKEFGVRMWAVRAVAPLSRPEAVRAVAQLASNPAFQVREAAALSLATAPRGDLSVVQALALLEDPAREVREAAVSSLPQVVALPDQPAAVAALVLAASQGAWPVQCAALRALACIVQDQTLVAEVAQK
ncbi:unnamed protein product [Polarella glacialis]|uniref:Uncharacterized protein n=1 Tax=Polarella glacialis TaxID=89957 RepID=A0A813JHR6_POLGL|nr:unnamed protein product [Polarella glacialis]